MEEDRDHCRQEMTMILEQVRNLQMENEELLDEIKLKNGEVAEYR